MKRILWHVNILVLKYMDNILCCWSWPIKEFQTFTKIFWNVWHFGLLGKNGPSPEQVKRHKSTIGIKSWNPQENPEKSLETVKIYKIHKYYKKMRKKQVKYIFFSYDSLVK